MKRIISCLLILVMMVAAIPASAAAKTAQLVLDAPFGIYGEELSVDVRVENLSDCNGFMLSLNYDSAVLKLTNFVEGKGGEFAYSESIKNGQYGIIWLDTSKSVKGNVLFGTLKFKILKKVESTTLKVNKVEIASGTKDELMKINYKNTTIPLYKNHPFTDVGNEWFKESVLFAYNNNLMNGMGNNAFKPNDITTRAMLVTILYRNEGEPEIKEKAPFTDLKQNWYKTPVNWAYKNKIVNGMSKKIFAPEETVTREQIATIMYRYADSKKINVSKRKSLNSFPDGKKVSSWAKEEMEWAYASGLITGNAINGKVMLDPQGAATRAQIATILMRYIKMTAGK